MARPKRLSRAATLCRIRIVASPYRVEMTRARKMHVTSPRAFVCRQEKYISIQIYSLSKNIQNKDNT